MPVGNHIGAPNWFVVYFIQAESGGPIKIGTSTRDSLEARLRSLQTGNPRKLVIRKTLEGSNLLEAELHRRFAADRLCGEWFWPSGELVDLADAPLKDHDVYLTESFREARKHILDAGYEQGYEDAVKDFQREAADWVEQRLEPESYSTLAAADKEAA